VKYLNKKIILIICIIIFSFKANSENFYCESKNNGNVYISPVGCFANTLITKEQFLLKGGILKAKTKEYYCMVKDTNEVFSTNWNKKCSINRKLNLRISEKKFLALKETNEVSYDLLLERSYNNCEKYPEQSICNKDISVNDSYEIKDFSFLTSQTWGDQEERKKLMKEANKRSKRAYKSCIKVQKDSFENLKKRLKNIPKLNCGIVGQVIAKKEASYSELAQSLGCGKKKRNECVQRWLPSIAGTGPINKDSLKEITKDKLLMGEIVLAIQEMQRQGGVREPTEEEKQQALAQQNATGQATWKYTSTGIGYFDFGNGFGWAPPNPKRDKIISGLYVSQRTKNKLMIGSRGRTIFIPR